MESNLWLPPLIFSFYKDLSEYYFTISAVSLIFGFSLFLKILYENRYGRMFFYLIIIMLFFDKISQFNSSKIGTNLYYQKQAVLYITSQKIDQIFNVSYSVPVNADAGFRYLFKYFQKEPKNTSDAHLWTIVIPSLREGVKPLAIFGDIGIIRR